MPFSPALSIASKMPVSSPVNSACEAMKPYATESMSTSSAGAEDSDRCDVRRHADAAIDGDGAHRNERRLRDASLSMARR